MNLSDEDLDCLLKTWTAPRSPDSLEGRLRGAYRERRQNRGSVAWPRWIARIAPIAGKFAAVLASGIILLAVITRAFPQSLNLIAPSGAITVDSEFLEYKDDGSYTVTEYRTSSFLEWEEMVWSSSFPGDPLRTAAAEFLNPARAILDPIAHSLIAPLFYKPGRAELLKARAKFLAERIRNGCTPTNMWGWPMTVIGKETVLNYTTTVVSRFKPEGRDDRFTEWLAPALDCFSLRSTREMAIADGTFRLVSERRVLKVEHR